MNLPYFQRPTPEKLATLFIEENTVNLTHSPTVEYQINSFVSSDKEPQDIGFSSKTYLNSHILETWSIVHTVMTNTNKKINSATAHKTKICSFVQNKVKKKLTQQNSAQNLRK